MINDPGNVSHSACQPSAPNRENHHMPRFACFLAIVVVTASWCADADACVRARVRRYCPTFVCHLCPGRRRSGFRCPLSANCILGRSRRARRRVPWLTGHRLCWLVGTTGIAESRGQWRRKRADGHPGRHCPGRFCHSCRLYDITDPGRLKRLEPETAEDAKLGPPVQQASNPAEVPDIIDL